MKVRAALLLGASLLLACTRHAATPEPPAPARAAPAPPPPKKSARRVAITIDNLPFVGPPAPGDRRREAIARILDALRSRRVPPAGFAVCKRIDPPEEGAALMRQWLAGGIDLGNHSTAHRSIDDLGLEAWKADVGGCKAELEKLAGKPVTLFRYPFLQSGRTPELRDAGVSALTAMGHRRAPVSIDTSEWALVQPYVDALAAGAKERASAIGRAYVAHVLTATRHYRTVAAELGRPDAAHVLLLHANALAADHLGAVLDALASEGFSFIGVEEALKDPVYAAKDEYAGAIGLSWLYRTKPETERWAWDAAQLHAFEVRFGGRDERAAFDLDAELSIRRLTDRTWIVTDRLPWPANSVLAEMDDGTLLFVGSPYTDDATQALLDWIEARFGARRKVSIATHFHPDGGPGGGRALARAGAERWALRATASLTRERRGAMRKLLADALKQRPALAARFANYDPLPADRLFDGELSLRFGAERVHAFFPGPGHSPDNIVVHLADRKILVGGCLLRVADDPGNLSDADLVRWPSTVEKLLALDPLHVVAGHGDRTDPGLIQHTLDVVRRAQ